MCGHVHWVWGRLAEARCSHGAPRIGHPPGPCAVRTAVTWARRFPLCQSHPDVGGWTISRPLRQRSPKSRHGRSSGDEPRGKASLRSVHTAVTGPACPHALMPMHAVWPTARPEPRSVGVSPPSAPRGDCGTRQETAAFTSSTTFCSTAGLHFCTANDTGHRSPSSRVAASWTPVSNTGC